MSPEVERRIYGIAMHVFLTVGVLAIGLAWAFPVKWCWNYTMPAIFTLPQISWGQAFCLIFLAHNLWRAPLIERHKKGE